ncbi:CobW family GTP-binding protein [Antarcticirhabdus aurantiaca]|uniref:GTP-binding protein n=1 Tax=Antarcticirhabdus aurantiaca TaxID=2606717 RepID=A0ACD4NNA2_9HYPH|nr:GTP-binding protein [Antarcticirhabdus aurantiaca]WAJ28193.1 GTP-binding protein [Jeongeuplla avenae]
MSRTVRLRGVGPAQAGGAEEGVERVPATLLTGFLGSGKTTLLNHLLSHPEMADTAVVINEFGDVAIDHLLVESAIENAVVLQSGCICCTVRGDLVDTLTDLLAKRASGALPFFSRIAIETTGLADPASIVQLFVAEPLVAKRFRLRAVVTTVDAVNGAGQLDAFAEAGRQVALADLLVVTKSDIAEPGTAAALVDRLSRLNPGASVLAIEQGRLSPDALFGAVPDTLETGGAVGAWLKADAFEPADVGGAGSGRSAHGNDIRAFALETSRSISAQGLKRWLGSILSLRGAALLRMKGLVKVEGLDGPIVLHAVQHVLHPPLRLARWPTADATTKLVFITNGLPAAGLLASFEAFCQEDRAGGDD